jgi:hypothetical protein
VSRLLFGLLGQAVVEGWGQWGIGGRQRRGGAPPRPRAVGGAGGVEP